MQLPALVGFASLQPADPPVKRTNLKDPVPCVAVGETLEGQRAVAVFVNGVDLDVVPFAVDAADMHGVAHIAVVARAKDLTQSMQKMAQEVSMTVIFRILDF
jgi:hypothetical protein